MGKEKHRLRRYIEDIEMIILGIETSCDETSVGVVDGDGFVLSNVVATQVDVHSLIRRDRSRSGVASACFGYAPCLRTGDFGIWD